MGVDRGAGYGILVAVNPGYHAGLTGIGIDGWVADFEVRSWWLTTELAFLILAYHGWKQPERYYRINVLIWTFMFAMLVGYRFIGTWIHGGPITFGAGPEDFPTHYHIDTAYAYELPSLLVFIYQAERCRPG